MTTKATLTVAKEKRDFIKSANLKNGEVARRQDGCIYFRLDGVLFFFYETSGGNDNLTSPTVSRYEGCGSDVELLPRGSTVTLTFDRI